MRVIGNVLHRQSTLKYKNQLLIQNLLVRLKRKKKIEISFIHTYKLPPNYENSDV